MNTKIYNPVVTIVKSIVNVRSYKQVKKFTLINARILNLVTSLISKDKH